MKYFKISQVVPGKGNAWTYYETDDSLTIQRILTHIPEVNETTLFPKPKIKSLFQPERLIKSDEKEFQVLWDKG
ncbi:MAG: hypothetical protein OEV78_06515 [Spirochaetia bacterium]|nr:hypothetical protein [Spirochaetia bacterium]